MLTKMSICKVQIRPNICGIYIRIFWYKTHLLLCRDAHQKKKSQTTSKAKHRNTVSRQTTAATWLLRQQKIPLKHDLTTFFPIFSTFSTESLNPKNGISIHCNYVKLEELIFDFANNTVHQLLVLGIRGPAQ